MVQNASNHWGFATVSWRLSSPLAWHLSPLRKIVLILKPLCRLLQEATPNKVVYIFLLFSLSSWSRLVPLPLFLHDRKWGAQEAQHTSFWINKSVATMSDTFLTILDSIIHSIFRYWDMSYQPRAAKESMGWSISIMEHSSFFLYCLGATNCCVVREKYQCYMQRITHEI